MNKNLFLSGIFMITFSSAQSCSSNEIQLTQIQEKKLQEAREALNQRPNPASWFITENGKPTPRLILLLQLDNLYDPNDNLEQIVAKTQKAWIQVQQGKDSKERTDLIDSHKQKEIRQKVEAIVQEIGLFDTRKPALEHYDYGACLGAFLDGVRLRLSILIDEWKKGVRFDSLIFFTGERYLRKEEGKQDSFNELLHPQNSPLKIKSGWQMSQDAPYETEYDMCRLVWEQTEIPEEMQKALQGKVLFINAPAPAGKERPSTRNCYETWLTNNNPQPGTILAPSHPVIWAYQQLAGENILGQQFPLDTISNAATTEVRKKYQEQIVSLVQDTAAKCLYELSQRNKVLTKDLP